MALYLLRPHLVIDDDGRTTGDAIPIRGLKYLGYTPLRIGKRIFFKRAEAGDNTGLVVNDQDPNAIELSQRVSCRLSFLLNWAGYLMTGQWAPYVWMEVTYRLTPTGPQVTFAGSTIPSQTVYLDDVNRGSHDMMMCSIEEVIAFMQTASSADAPARAPIRI